MNKSALLTACLMLPILSFSPVHAQSEALQACVSSNEGISHVGRVDACTEVIENSGSLNNQQVQYAYASRGKSFCKMGKQDRALADFMQSRDVMHGVLSEGSLGGKTDYDGLNVSAMDEAFDLIVSRHCTKWR